MKKQANGSNAASSNVQKANQSKESDWRTHLLGPVIVGVVVLIGQSVIAPWVAREVKRKESILEQRYKICANAVDILQRYLASAKIKGGSIPKKYMPPEKTRPTQVETNVTYTLLAIYGKSSAIAEQFRKAAVGDKGKHRSADIVKFISAVRKELGVDKKGFTGDDFSYIFVHPMDENGQEDTEPNDEQKE